MSNQGNKPTTRLQEIVADYKWLRGTIAANPILCVSIAAVIGGVIVKLLTVFGSSC